MPFGAFAPLPLRLGGSDEEGWSPEQHARFCADLVAVKRVSPLARLFVNQDATNPYAVSVVYYFGQNGSGLAYAPTVTNGGAGIVSLAFPSYWTDEYEVQQAFQIRQALATPQSSSAATSVVSISSNTVTVRTFNDSGVAAALPFSLRVW